MRSRFGWSTIQAQDDVDDHIYFPVPHRSIGFSVFLFLCVSYTRSEYGEGKRNIWAMRRAAWAMGGEGIEWGNASSGRARGIWRHSVGRYPCISGFLFFSSSPFFSFPFLLTHLIGMGWDGIPRQVGVVVWAGESLFFLLRPLAGTLPVWSGGGTELGT